MPNPHRINEQIRISPVQVVTQAGELLVKPTPEAIELARQAGLDLVEVGPEAQPPVCRIMDNGKFLYEQKQKAKWPWPPRADGSCPPNGRMI
jgi:translation initiation factor IF-3